MGMMDEELGSVLCCFREGNECREAPLQVFKGRDLRAVESACLAQHEFCLSLSAMHDATRIADLAVMSPSCRRTD